MTQTLCHGPSQTAAGRRVPGSFILHRPGGLLGWVADQVDDGPQCWKAGIVTENWVDSEHLQALGRVVVAATWLETVLDHVVRVLVDDGPVYHEVIAGQNVSKLCDLAIGLASRVVPDGGVRKDLGAWIAGVRRVTGERNGLLHPAHLESEGDGPRDRRIIVGHRAKRKVPPVEISASLADIDGIARLLDALSESGIALIGELARTMVRRDGQPAQRAQPE